MPVNVVWLIFGIGTPIAMVIGAWAIVKIGERKNVTMHDLFKK